MTSDICYLCKNIQKSEIFDTSCEPEHIENISANVGQNDHPPIHFIIRIP